MNLKKKIVSIIIGLFLLLIVVSPVMAETYRINILQIDYDRRIAQGHTGEINIHFTLDIDCKIRIETKSSDNNKLEVAEVNDREIDVRAHRTSEVTIVLFGVEETEENDPVKIIVKLCNYQDKGIIAREIQFEIEVFQPSYEDINDDNGNSDDDIDEEIEQASKDRDLGDTVLAIIEAIIEWLLDL